MFEPPTPPDYSGFKFFKIEFPHPFVAHVIMNRPAKYNSFIEAMWFEYGSVFDKLAFDPEVRVIVLSGAGDKAFTTGLDVSAASANLARASGDPARISRATIKGCMDFQQCISASERCDKPVICVLHGFSFGLAVDIACTTDIRICSADTKFAVKEVDIGLAADLGTLSRLPKLVGNFSWVKDVCLSARVFGAEEALRQGFVSEVVSNKASAITRAMDLAKVLAEKSPIGTSGTKHILNLARDQTIPENLRYTAVWTGSALQANDVKDAMLSGMQKRKPTFEKL